MAGNPTPARWPVFSLLTRWLTEPRGKTSNDIAALAGLSGEEAARICGPALRICAGWPDEIRATRNSCRTC